MHIELMSFGAALGALAFMAKLTARQQRAWLERDLNVGDLRVLSDVAFRRTLRPHFDPVQRLCQRGFLVETDRAPRCCRLTLRGWIAIILRHTFAGRPNLWARDTNL